VAFVTKVNGWRINWSAVVALAVALGSITGTILTFLVQPDGCPKNPLHPIACSFLGNALGWQIATPLSKACVAVTALCTVFLACYDKVVRSSAGTRATDPVPAAMKGPP
jgi:hypothetical protein